MKAYAPSMQSFMECTNEVQEIAKEVQCLLEKCEQMRDSLATKIDRGSVPCIEDFDDKGILMKTNNRSTDFR